jgi:dinuclear metal center YbgI/SA1388 family protein
MQVSDVIAHLESVAPKAYQEAYDNSGLLAGNPQWECRGALVTLDSTEEVIAEAVARNCNLVVSHHPIIFGGIKTLSPGGYVQNALIKAVKEDIAIYAVHTNLDNMLEGVNGRMADMLGLVDRKVLEPKNALFKKLVTFVPQAFSEAVRLALFEAGAGHIGRYEEASFSTEGEGTYKPLEGAHPFLGKVGARHLEKETKIEVLFPTYLQSTVVQALIRAHPYEEVAYDVLPLSNVRPDRGSGLIGDLKIPMGEKQFLNTLKVSFRLQILRHTPLSGKPIKKVALCGGAGSFLISNALVQKADIFVSSDFKYHDFFDAEGRIVIVDIGHFESEQYTVDLLSDILREKFPTFAVLKSGTITNPVNYYL